MSLSTTLTFPCGFLNRKQMKTILKAFCERLSTGVMSTRCHQTLLESRSALNFYINRAIKLFYRTYSTLVPDVCQTTIKLEN